MINEKVHRKLVKQAAFPNAIKIYRLVRLKPFVAYLARSTDKVHIVVKRITDFFYALLDTL